MHARTRVARQRDQGYSRTFRRRRWLRGWHRQCAKWFYRSYALQGRGLQILRAHTIDVLGEVTDLIKPIPDRELEDAFIRSIRQTDLHRDEMVGRMGQGNRVANRCTSRDAFLGERAAEQKD